MESMRAWAYTHLTRNGSVVGIELSSACVKHEFTINKQSRHSVNITGRLQSRNALQISRDGWSQLRPQSGLHNSRPSLGQTAADFLHH